MKTRAIAIFDIGKTNKKLLLFDESYQILQEENISFPETVDEDGFPTEDIGKLADWILAKYKILTGSELYEIGAVNFTTYGASLVHTGTDGNRVAPLYNYLKPYPDGLLEELANKHGGTVRFSTNTSSPLMGHLNAGLQLYWLKKMKPQVFEKINAAFHFPQYLSYLITGKKLAEVTHLGCHSAMWDFGAMNYHGWLKEEGIDTKLAKVVPGDFATVLNGNIAVGVGLHDSSAAIIPYISSYQNPFAIISTGTWTISLNPFNSALPTSDELAKGCLSYLTYKAKPVKTTMLFAGNDHDVQTKRIAAHFNIDSQFYRSLKYDKATMAITENILEKADINLDSLLEKATTPSPFAARDLNSFANENHAYHQLIADISAQQYLSTSMVLQNSNVEDIYVDGGFCKNGIYMQCLANLFQDKKIYAATMIQGTALGAALAMHSHWNTKPVPQTLTSLERWMPAL